MNVLLLCLLFKKKKKKTLTAYLICVGTTGSVPNAIVLSSPRIVLAIFLIVVCLSRAVQGVTSPD